MALSVDTFIWAKTYLKMTTVIQHQGSHKVVENIVKSNGIVFIYKVTMHKTPNLNQIILFECGQNYEGA